MIVVLLPYSGGKEKEKKSICEGHLIKQVSLYSEWITENENEVFQDSGREKN